MPWTVDSPPDVAQNWTADEQRRCVDAANAVLADGGNDERAISACIRAAGKAESDQGKGDSHMTMERKSFPVFETKVVDEDQGIVEMVWSVMGNVDGGNDVVHPGAFAKTFTERGQKIKLLDMHRTDSIMRVLGKPLEFHELSRDQLPPNVLAKYPEATGGAWARVQYFLDTPEGKGAFIRIKRGAVDEYSFAYDALDYDHTKAIKDGKEITVRNLRTLKVYEIGPVLWGMNPATATVSAKAEEDPDGDPDAEPAGEKEDEFHQARALRGMVSGTDTNDASEAKEGRVLSAKNRELIGRCVSEMGQAAQALNELLTATEPNPEKAMNLTRQISETEKAFIDQFNATGEYRYWPKEVWDEYLIVGADEPENGHRYFRVPYSQQNGAYTFAPRAQWQPGEYVFTPAPMPNAQNAPAPAMADRMGAEHDAETATPAEAATEDKERADTQPGTEAGPDTEPPTSKRDMLKLIELEMTELSLLRGN